MSEHDTDSMRADKDDRYTVTESKSHNPMAERLSSIHFSKRTIIIILIAFILLLLASYFVFRPPAPENTSPSDNLLTGENTEQVTDGTTESGETNTATNSNGNYTAIEPAPISRDPTQSKPQESSNHQERLEIPGEITDQIEQKILELNKTGTSDTPARIQLGSKPTDINYEHNEKPLTTNLSTTHYTIQLSASSSLQNLLDFAKKYQISNYQVYETRKGQDPWFVLIKGDFANQNDAKAAIQALPDALKANSPWIKSGLAVQKDKQAK